VPKGEMDLIPLFESKTHLNIQIIRF